MTAPVMDHAHVPGNDARARRRRDPSTYSESAVLRDGGSVWIRAIRASDKSLLADHFRSLGPQSVHDRFFHAKKSLSDQELTYFTEVDFDTHVALVALIHEEGKERIAGVARYYRTRDRVAEVALAVAEAHQGRGMGTLLLERLVAIAGENGIREIEAEVLADNAKMLDVFAHLGVSIRQSIEAGVFHITFPIQEEPPSSPPGMLPA